MCNAGPLAISIFMVDLHGLLWKRRRWPGVQGNRLTVQKPDKVLQLGSLIKFTRCTHLSMDFFTALPVAFSSNPQPRPGGYIPPQDLGAVAAAVATNALSIAIRVLSHSALPDRILIIIKG